MHTLRQSPRKLREPVRWRSNGDLVNDVKVGPVGRA